MERMTDERRERLGRYHENGSLSPLERREILDEMDRARASEAAMSATMTRAAAELRHAYRSVGEGCQIDPGLVARAIEMLERGVPK